MDDGIIFTGYREYGYIFKKDYRLTMHHAKLAANEMRLKKISSLKKQLAKYEKMRF